MKTKALTKSPAQLDREIAETLKAAPRSAEKPKRYRLTIAGPTGRYTESAFTATEDQAIAAARRELESGAVHVRVETGVDYLLGTASTLVANLRK